MWTVRGPRPGGGSVLSYSGAGPPGAAPDRLRARGWRTGTHTAQQRRVALLAGAAEGAPRWRTSLAGLASGFPGGSQRSSAGGAASWCAEGKVVVSRGLTGERTPGSRLGAGRAPATQTGRPETSPPT